MASSFEHTNLPLAGDILDDFAIIFRELLNKVNTIIDYYCQLVISKVPKEHKVYLEFCRYSFCIFETIQMSFFFLANLTINFIICKNTVFFYLFLFNRIINLNAPLSVLDFV